MLASIGATRVFAAGGVGALAATYWCFRRARFAVDDALVRVLGFNALFYVSLGSAHGRRRSSRRRAPGETSRSR